MNREDAPINAADAEAMGWTVDRHTYPWCAYTGPRFAPARIVDIDTPPHQTGRRQS